MLAGLLLAGLLVVLVAKPWGSPSPPATFDRSTSPSGAPAAASAAAVASPAPAPSEQCEFALGWRVFVAEAGDPIGEWAGDRRWLAVDPVASADSPSDTSIPWVLVTERANALGYCAPGEDGGGPPAGTGMTAWAVGPGGVPTRLPLVDLSSGQAGGEPTEGLFALVVGGTPGDGTPQASPSGDGTAELPPTPDGVELGWPQGRYVLRLSDRSGYARWFGVELRYPATSPGAPTGPDASGVSNEPGRSTDPGRSSEPGPSSEPGRSAQPVPTGGTTGSLPGRAETAGGVVRS